MNSAATKYQRRTPEQTLLYQVIEQNISAFRTEVSSKEKYLPLYVDEEFEAFLRCGILENGFLRIRCNDCHDEKVLAFSCKRRGFCPSCCGRRMNESDIRISKEVFPKVPARQWVLSLPMPLRFVCARDRAILNSLVHVFYSEVTNFIIRRLRELGHKDAKTGGILVIQRLGGALNLNVHFHAIFLDGGYVIDDQTGRVQFCDLSDSLTSSDIAKVVEKIFARSLKVLKNMGCLEDGELMIGEGGEDAVKMCDGASVKNKIAFGERAGKPVRRIKLQIENGPAQIRGDLVAELGWFNLKADKVVKANQRHKLSRLVRYITRPPLAHERLSLGSDGTIRYRMKRVWTDGTAEIQFSAIELLEKLAAAVPPPNGHLIRYFGVLAPNAKLRRAVVLVPKPKARDENGRLRPLATQRASWAEIAKHAFQIDLKKCEVCGGDVRAVAVIRDPRVINLILEHLGLKDRARRSTQSSRAPPARAAVFSYHPEIH